MNLEDYLYSKGLSKSTVKHYHKHTLDFLAWLDGGNTEAEQATAGDVTAYLNHLKNKGQGNVTRSIHLNVLKHFFDYQVSIQQRVNNPARHLKIRGSKRKMLYQILSKAELESIYQQYKVPQDNEQTANRNWFRIYQLSRQRNKAVLGLMIWQGLTTPEINHLAVNDLKLREGTVFIAGSRKSNERVMELKPQQVIELMEYQFTTRKELLKYCPAADGHLFISAPAAGKTTGTGKDTANIWKALSAEVKQLCPRFINFKQVRTSVITHWLSGYNLRQVQYMAGHKYVSSTESYQVNQVEDLQADIDQFHPIG
jgi:site-specific recombinase XerD